MVWSNANSDPRRGEKSKTKYRILVPRFHSSFWFVANSYSLLSKNSESSDRRLVLVSAAFRWHYFREAVAFGRGFVVFGHQNLFVNAKKWACAWLIDTFNKNMILLLRSYSLILLNLHWNRLILRYFRGGSLLWVIRYFRGIVTIVESLLSGIVTIGGSLLSGVVTIGGSLLSGDRYNRGLATIGGSLLSGDRYYRTIVTIGGSLLSGVCYYRGFVTIGGRYYWEIVTIGGSLLSGDCCYRGSLLSEFNGTT